MSAIKMFKRFYHPGMNGVRKLCLPMCPSNQTSVYYQHVWGNKIQEIQLKGDKDNSYETNDINFYSHGISKFFNDDTVYLPSSHNTPVTTAIRSLRNVDPSKFLTFMEKNGMLTSNLSDDANLIDYNGVFIDTNKNRDRMMRLLNICQNKREKNIIKNAIFGIFSNFGDSVYIANDFLSVSDDKLVIANYPDKVSGREIERCRIVAYSLLTGNYPIILDKNINFEGEANVKFIPAMVDHHIGNGQTDRYQMCFGYDSSRSCTKSIPNINKYLKMMNIPQLKEICLYPDPNVKEYFYHFDCIVNFHTDNEDKTQYFEISDNESFMSFMDSYRKNGTVVVEMNGINDKEKTKAILESIFENIVIVSKDDDLLCANMIMMQNGIVGSSRLTNQDDFESLNRTYFFNHPSTGGGGAHKCCSNVIIDHKTSISVDNWLEFLKEYEMQDNINSEFIQGVKDEIVRIKGYYPNF